MKICGLQKTTLLDFPGQVAATVFLGGCNFRCPFCHNAPLLAAEAESLMPEGELLAFLEKRARVLTGVCISGGEPTLWPERLEALIREIRSLGYRVKLDTNGYRPDVLERLCRESLVDYVAMDIKSGRKNYPSVCGVPDVSLSRIEESASFLMTGGVPYEFRTTAVRELHSAEDFTDIAQWIGGCERYFIQGFVDSGHVLKEGFSAFSRAELEEFLTIARQTIPAAQIRGVDS